jgi:hypothetical protein
VAKKLKSRKSTAMLAVSEARQQLGCSPTKLVGKRRSSEIELSLEEEIVDAVAESPESLKRAAIGDNEGDFVADLRSLLKLPPAKRPPVMKKGGSYADLSYSRMYELYQVAMYIFKCIYINALLQYLYYLKNNVLLCVFNFIYTRVYLFF